MQNRIMRAACVLVAVAIAMAGCSDAPSQAEPSLAEPHRFNTEIRWTSYGIPHVRADDWGSLGYGFAYATATDAICVIARDVMVVNGDQARFEGALDGHVASDVFHRAILTPAKLEDYGAAQSERSRAFAAGYVAGYNRYLRDFEGRLPESCADAAWVRPITLADVDRLAIGVGIRYGLGRFRKEIAGAAPGAESPDGQDGADGQQAVAATEYFWPAGIGSNAVAVGRALSASGRGILLGNPHYPWHGPSRFHMIHTTIPGELDVMGVSLLNTNRVAIGFNQDMAWTHTVSTALRFTLYQLMLDPEDPHRYQYDGAYRSMDKHTVQVTVRGADGRTRQTDHTVYFTRFGPVIENDALRWSDRHAYALRDAVLDNYHTADTYDALNKAASTAEVEQAISRQGVYWTNTIAADRHGNAFYADISGTPNVDAELLDACAVQVEGLPERLVVLDGSRADCEWRQDPRSAVPGTLPAESMPRLTRDDYVTNSNDSYWLSNPQAPLEGYSPVIGSERTARSLRTRAGLSLMAEMIAEGEKLEADDIQGMLYAHRNFGAELLLDDVLAVCQADEDVGDECTALKAWDRTMNVDSRGGHLWREFWDTARHIEGLYAVPFDPADPVNTPAGVRSDEPAVRAALINALRKAGATLRTAGIALDAPLREIQFAERNGRRIPVPGGEGWAGMFSMIQANLKPSVGYTPIVHGNSFIQVITWDADGNLQPKAMLTYAQSPEPESPHFSDLTEMYARGGWIDLPFSEDQIKADPNLVTLTLTE